MNLKTKIFFATSLLILVCLNLNAQVFIPFGYWQKVIVAAANYAPTISTIMNRSIYEGNNPFIPFTIADANDVLTCTLTNLTRTSSNTTVVPLSNITFTGTAPFCYVNIAPAAGQTGTSDITITVNDNNAPNLQASTTFTVTAYAVTGVTVLPVYSIIPKNTTFQYIAMASFSDGSSQDISTAATWTEDTTNTTISSAGLLTVDNGVTGYPALTVTATYGIFSGIGTATLNSSTVTGIFTTPVSATVNPGNTKNIKCYALTSDAGTIDVTASCTWTTSDGAVANVNTYYPRGQVTAYSNGGPVTITATFGAFSDTTAITVAETAETEVEEGIGLFARYFTGMGFTTFFRQRVDSNVAYGWGTGNNPAGGANTFSVRWTGQVLAPETGVYTFYTYSDDGFRLWVNDTLIDDFWTDHGPTASTATNISLTAGIKYNIVVEFYENGGDAHANVRWKVPSSGCASYAACVAVPRANLFPTSGEGMPLNRAGNSDVVTTDRDFINDNFIRHYNADGTGGISDGATVAATVGGVNLTATNTNGTGLSYVAGLISQAFQFDGIDDLFTGANTTLSTGTSARGFSVWVKPNNTGADQGIFFHGANTNLNGFGALIRSTGVVRVHGGGTDTCNSSNSLTWGSWNHIAIRFAGAGGNVSVYVNGTTTSCGNKAWNTSAGNLTIGSNPSVAGLFSGDMDEFGLWNANISANANNFLPTLIYQRQNPSPIYSP
jgi:hypothetical protein